MNFYKMNLIFYTIAISLIGSSSSVEFIPDLYEDRTFIREQDTLSISLKNLLNFEHTSINFSSPNGGLKLPGIPSSNAISFPMQSTVDAKVFKSKDDRVFTLSAKGNVLKAFEFIDGKLFKEIEFPLSRQVQSLKNFNCVDLVFGEEKWLYVLCKANQSSDNSSKETAYVVFSADYLRSNEITRTNLTLTAFENPSMKFISKNNKTGFEMFMVYCKGLESSELKSLHSVVDIITLQRIPAKREPVKQKEKVKEIDGIKRLDNRLMNIVSEEKVVLINRQLVDLSVALVGSERSIGVQNLAIRFATKLEIWGSFYSLGSESSNSNSKDASYFTCDVVDEQTSNAIKISDCSIREEKVKIFFLKENDFILVDTRNKIQLCTVGVEKCRSGTLPREWEVKRLLLENRIGVILVQIEESLFLFMSDFQEKEFFWRKVSGVVPETTFLLKVLDRKNQKNILVSFAEKSFGLLDISMNKILQVEKASLDNNSRVKVELEGATIMNLDVQLYKNEEPINVRNDKPIPVVKSLSRYFKTRLPIEGSKLQFAPSMSHTVLYFNHVETNLSFEDSASQVYTYQNFIYAFEKAKVRIFSFFFVPNSKKLGVHRLLTNFIKEISYKPIEPSGITSIDISGDILIATFAESENTILIDTHKNELILLNLNERFHGGKDCKINMNFLFCMYSDHLSEGFQVIRGFKIVGGQLEEHPGIEQAFTAFAKEKLKDKSENLSEVLIKSFDLEAERSNNLIVFFNLISGGLRRHEIHKFKVHFALNGQSSCFHRKIFTNFSENHSIKPSSKMMCFDKQIVFSTLEPAFDSVVYDMGSTYHLEYIPTTEILVTETLKSRGILAYVYRHRTDQTSHLIVYKVIQNAAKQTIFSQVLPEWGKNSSIQLTILDNSVVGVWYFRGDGKFLLHAFFEEGPVLIGSETESNLLVNDKEIDLHLSEDTDFGIILLKRKRNPKMFIEPGEQLPLEDVLSVSGHLLDVTIKSDAIKIFKPLEPIRKEDKNLSEVKVGNSLMVSDGENRFAIEGKDPHSFLVIDDGKVSQVSVKETEGRHCFDVALTQFALFCFWKSGALFYLTRVELESGSEKKFEIGHGGFFSSVVKDSKEQSILARIRDDNSYLEIIFVNNIEGTVVSKYIGRAKLATSNLRISDYHVYFNEKTGILTSLILDTASNKLHIFYGEPDKKSRPSLRRSYSLDDLSLSFRNITCSNLHSFISENQEYSCILFSDSSFFSIKLVQMTQGSLSDFVLSLEVEREFKNALYDESFDPRFELAENVGPNLIALRNKHSLQKNDQIYCYLPESTHLRFRYEMGTDELIRFTSFSKDYSEYQIYYSINNKLYLRTLKIGDYIMEKSEEKFNEIIPAFLTVHFLENQSELIDFELLPEPKHGPMNAKPQRNKRKIALIGSIVLVSIALVGSIVALLYFYRKRNQRLLELNGPELVQ